MSGSPVRRLALFDLDGTLLRGSSSERCFARHLVRTGALGPRQALAWLAFAASPAAHRAGHVLKRDKGYLHRLGVQRVALEARRCTERLFERGAFDPDVLAALARHGREGERTVLLSGTLQPLADAVAERLGIDEAVGTLVPVRGDRYGFGAPTRHPFGPAKRSLARAIAARHGVPSERVIAYGDSVHDVALLAWAGTAVAVAPDAALSRIARRNGWAVLPHAPEPPRRTPDGKPIAGGLEHRPSPPLGRDEVSNGSARTAPSAAPAARSRR